ncbi:MAG: hypothetical protein H6Q08_524, partial [Acidobacteria bacterium]|nr:hypothetical protein [Acidobacteriota bacterium]
TRQLTEEDRENWADGLRDALRSEREEAHQTRQRARAEVEACETRRRKLTDRLAWVRSSAT